jgi:hypothetical protein
MNLDPKDFGLEEVTPQDREYRGSKFSEVWAALLANRYYQTWGTAGEPPLPVYDVTLGRVLSGLFPWPKDWRFQQAADRTIDSQADMRWGSDGKGFRRIVHPNGVCLKGIWKIDEAPAGTPYTGYFQCGKEGLVIARYSTCCAECRRGRYRSLALVGKLYPTTDPDDERVLRPANFVLQEDIGGAKSNYINDAELRNAPDTSPWRRGKGLPILLITGLVLFRADKQPTFRQTYTIAELDKSSHDPTRAPQFMRLRIADSQPRVEGADLDFRDEILAQIYDQGDPYPKRKLTFDIEVSDVGKTHGIFFPRRTIRNWKRIGRIVFEEAVASYNGDFVIHFHHPPWRNDRNDPSTLARRPRS